MTLEQYKCQQLVLALKHDSRLSPKLVQRLSVLLNPAVTDAVSVLKLMCRSAAGSDCLHHWWYLWCCEQMFGNE
jgi:hypothetical protein